MLGGKGENIQYLTLIIYLYSGKTRKANTQTKLMLQKKDEKRNEEMKMEQQYKKNKGNWTVKITRDHKPSTKRLEIASSDLKLDQSKRRKLITG